MFPSFNDEYIFDRLNLIEITIISSNIIVRSSPLRLFALVQYSAPGLKLHLSWRGDLTKPTG